MKKRPSHSDNEATKHSQTVTTSNGLLFCTRALPLLEYLSPLDCCHCERWCNLKRSPPEKYSCAKKYSEIDAFSRFNDCCLKELSGKVPETNEVCQPALIWKEMILYYSNVMTIRQPPRQNEIGFPGPTFGSQINCGHLLYGVLHSVRGHFITLRTLQCSVTISKAWQHSNVLADKHK